MKVRLDVLTNEGGQWYVYSEDRTKRLGGPYRSRAEAEKRLRQIEYFKHRKDAEDPVVAKRKMVAHEVALQRKFGGKRRRGRLPRQIEPKPIVVEYGKVLRALIRNAATAYAPILAALRRASVRKDDKDFSSKLKREAARNTFSEAEFSVQARLGGREARRMLDDAEKALANTVSTTQVETLASKFAARTSTYQRIQLGRQVRAALGVDPFIRDIGLSDEVDDFVAQNVSLITRIPKRLHEKIEGMVMNAVNKPELNVNLADDIEEQFGVAERHAMLIARDQIAKFYGAVNRQRQENLGVKKFIWRTVSDERVRKSHEELDGEEFSWDDLPVNERGEKIYPGSDYQCRCYSEPVLDDLADEVDAAEQTLDTGGIGFGLEPAGFDDEPEEE